MMLQMKNVLLIYLDHSMEEVDNKAIDVLNRIHSKLTGTDFSKKILNVKDQVEKLICQATDEINLCQAYIGWCPFW